MLQYLMIFYLNIIWSYGETQKPNYLVRKLKYLSHKMDLDGLFYLNLHMLRPIIELHDL